MDEKIATIARKVFRLSQKEIKKNWTSNDIPNWDSLAHLNLILGIEKEFSVKFDIEDIFQIRCIGDISIILKKKLNR